MERLEKIREFLQRQDWPYQYEEENDSGSIEFIHRGLAYHIWEYPEPERGAASNVANAGRMVDYEGDYEAQILAILQTWDNGRLSLHPPAAGRQGRLPSAAAQEATDF